MKQSTEREPEATRERLEERAKRVRARLFDDVDELNARVENVAERVEAIKAVVRKHPGVVAGVAAGAAIALGVVLYARRGRERRQLRRDAILGVAARLLGPAYVVESSERRPGMLSDSVKRAGVALVAALGRELGRRALVAIRAPGADGYHAEAQASG